MLKIVEVKSEEHFQQLRQQEDTSHDYLYICKHCNEIKLSDNGEILNINDITVTPKYSTGTLVASISVNGQKHNIYAPTSGSNGNAPAIYTSTQICVGAQISNLTNYMTSSISIDSLNYEYILYKVRTEDASGVIKDYVNLIKLELTIGETSKDIVLQAHTPINVRLTKDSISAISYGGAWYKIYVTLIGYKTGIYDKIFEDYNTMTS